MTQVIQPTITRRKAIIAGTTTLLGAAGLALGTQEAGAQASVDMGELAVEPAELAPEDSEVFAPWVIISGTYEYRVDEDPTEWQTFILLGDGAGNTEAVGINSGALADRQGSGSYAVSGAITAASFYEPADFRVPDSESSITVSVPIEVAFVVRNAGGDMLVQARADDTATVTVTHGGVMASLSGAGHIVMQDDSGDPTPDLPEV